MKKQTFAFDQYAGIGNLAADQVVAGRVFASGSGCGVIFSYR